MFIDRREYIVEQYEYHNFIIKIGWYDEKMMESFAVPTKYSHIFKCINHYTDSEHEVEDNEDFAFFYEQPFIDYRVEYTRTQYHLDCLIEQINDFLQIEPKTVVLKQIYKKSITPKSSKNKRGFNQVAWASMVKLRDGKCTQCASVYDLHAHHIIPFKNNEDLRYDVNNGVTLCGQCHRQWHKENGK
jgi:5-methylcytosine-specific restriction endonuclease McrA